MRKTSVILLCFAVLVVSLLAWRCGQPELVGRWKNPKEDTVEFFQDGTISFTTTTRAPGSKYQLYTSVVSGTFRSIRTGAMEVRVNAAILGNRTYIVRYAVAGDTLTWNEEPSGYSTTYRRVQ